MASNLLDRFLEYVPKKIMELQKRVNRATSIKFPLFWSRNYFPYAIAAIIFIAICLLVSLEILISSLISKDDQSTLHGYHEVKAGLIIIGLAIFYTAVVFHHENSKESRKYFTSELFNLAEERKCTLFKSIVAVLVLSAGLLLDTMVRSTTNFIPVRQILVEAYKNECGPAIQYEFYYLTQNKKKKGSEAIRLLRDSMLSDVIHKYPDVVEARLITDIIDQDVYQDSVELITNFLSSKYYLSGDKIDEFIKTGNTQLLRLNRKEWNRLSTYVLDKTKNEIDFDSRNIVNMFLFLALVLVPAFLYFYDFADRFNKFYLTTVKVLSVLLVVEGVFLILNSYYEMQNPVTPLGILTGWLEGLISLMNDNPIVVLLIFAPIYIFAFPYFKYKLSIQAAAP